MINRIYEDIKQSMKNKEIVKRDTLKMVLNTSKLLAKDAKIETPTDEMVLNAIKKELKQSSTTEYICNDGTVIHTDVGYVEDWFNKYEQVLRRRMENEHAGT
jgi:hypothetical protein